MDDLQSYIEKVQKKHGLPSLAVAIYQENKPDQYAVCGKRSVNSPSDDVTIHDKFHFGSCGKAITAALIHKLIGQGRFKISDRLEDILPGVMPEDKKDITVSQLLTHTAGLQSNTTLEPDEHPKRGEFHYSNIGYMMLGEIAETVTGKHFKQLVKEEIFDPQTMHSVGFGAAAKDSQKPDQPLGHRRDELTKALQPFNTDNPDMYAAAGGMHATISDWLTFLKSETQSMVVKNPCYAVKDGEDWYTESAFSQHADGTLSHNGSNTYNYAIQVLMPHHKAAFLVVTNDGSEQARLAVEEVRDYLKAQIIKEAKLPRRPVINAKGV